MKISISRIIIEKINNKSTPEDCFLDIINDLEVKEDKIIYPNSTFFIKDNLVYFELNKKTRTLCCHYDVVWSVFHYKFGMEWLPIQAFIKKQMKIYFQINNKISVYAQVRNHKCGKIFKNVQTTNF